MDKAQSRRIVVTTRGGPNVLEVVTEDVPEPGPDEVRVRTLAAGVSSYEVMLCQHWFPERFPLTEASRAHQFMERGGHAGKVVLTADA